MPDASFHRFLILFQRGCGCIISLLLMIVTISLLIFMAFETRDVLISSVLAPQTRNFLHDVSFMLIVIKAVKLVLYYLRFHLVSLRYLLEISFIAPATEIIFAPDKMDFRYTLLFAAFSLLSLIIYIQFFDRIRQLDERPKGV